MVVEVAVDHRLEPGAEFRDGFVSPLHQLRTDLLQLRRHSFGDGLAPDDRCPLQGHAIPVRESQKVERLWLALTPPFPVSGREVPKFDQAGLVRVQVQAEGAQTLPQFGQKPFPVTLPLKAHDEVVSIADTYTRP